MTPKSLYHLAAAIAAAGSLIACSSSPQRNAQWVEPGLGTQSHILRGAKVLVACDVRDIALRRICEGQVFDELRSRGALPISAPTQVATLSDREFDAQLLPSAAEVGARALFVMQMTPASSGSNVSPSIGLGGFGVFGGGGGIGIGLGLPIGRSNVGSTGFAANGRVTEVASQRLLWTATFIAQPSSDLEAQFKQLSAVVMDAAKDAGLF